MDQEAMASLRSSFNMPQPDELLAAINNGDTQAVKSLLSDGADPSGKDKYKNTALIMATLHGHEDIVKLLLAYGADAASKDAMDQTALDWAKKFSRTKIILQLEQHERYLKILQEIKNPKQSPSQEEKNITSETTDVISTMTPRQQQLREKARDKPIKLRRNPPAKPQ